MTDGREERRQVVVKRRQSREGTERSLSDVLELSWGEGGGVWIDGGGWSMFPTSPPGCRLWVVRRSGAPQIGQVVVFPQGRRLVAHRLVAYSAAGCVPKGDGAVSCDPAIEEAKVLGAVERMRIGGIAWRANADPRLAAISRRLGGLFENRPRVAPMAVRRAAYLLVAVPALLAMMVLSSLGGRR